MDREKIFKTFFKYNDNGEQKFCNFNQLTAIGKRITFIVLNKARIEQLKLKLLLIGSERKKS